MNLDLTLLFVFRLSPRQFGFRNRENLAHRVFEFLGRFFRGFGWWHEGRIYAPGGDRK